MPDRSPPSPRVVAMAVGVTLALLFAVFLTYLAWRVITWMIIALFLALALEHGVRFFQGRGLPRGLAIATVFVLGLLGATGLGFVFIPPLVTQVADFVGDIPNILERLSQGRGPLGSLEREYGVVDRVRDFVGADGGASAAFERLSGPLLSVLESAAVAVVAAISIVFLTLFMLTSGPAWADGILGTVPERQRPYWQRAFRGIYDAIGGWVIGAATIALIAGTTAAVVLLVMGVPYALTLGVLVGALTPLPFVGATLAATIVALVVLATEGWLLAVVFIAFFLGYQQLENHVFYPLVFGRTVELSALAVLAAVILGAELAGVVGAIAAIPITGAIKVVSGEVMRYRRDRLTGAPPLEAPRP